MRGTVARRDGTGDKPRRCRGVRAPLPVLRGQETGGPARSRRKGEGGTGEEGDDQTGPRDLRDRRLPEQGGRVRSLRGRSSNASRSRRETASGRTRSSRCSRRTSSASPATRPGRQRNRRRPSSASRRRSSSRGGSPWRRNFLAVDKARAEAAQKKVGLREPREGLRAQEETLLRGRPLRRRARDREDPIPSRAGPTSSRRRRTWRSSSSASAIVNRGGGGSRSRRARPSGEGSSSSST